MGDSHWFCTKDESDEWSCNSDNGMQTDCYIFRSQAGDSGSLYKCYAVLLGHISF